MQTISFDFYSTLVVMVLVLLLGAFLNSRIKVLSKYNIPEAVVGGIIAASLFLLLRVFGDIKLSFDGSLKEPLMLAFFSSIGLLADFSSLKKGGNRLFIFLVITSVLLVLQNAVGIGIATALGENYLMGLLAGSITMSGGHGTGAAWASVFGAEPYSFAGALEVAVAAATFGLVIGGIIGGPVATYLIKKHKLKTPGDKTENIHIPITELEAYKERKITQSSFTQSLALLAICLLVGVYLADFVKRLELSSITLPTFVYCLFTGVILRNSLSMLKIHEVFDREVGLLGNVSLALFLAFALMDIDLVKLANLALPIFSVLFVQSVLMVFFAIFVTFRFCGKDYDAAVLSAGHCGFGMGATPTAMVNMQAVCKNYGMSHTAFIIVPLCGAFFIDIVNSFVIKGFLSLF